MNILPPERLTRDHEIFRFSCEDVFFTNWLQQYAHRNMKNGSSVTYVVSEIVDGQKHVIAYYTLGNTGISKKNLPKKYQEGMPNEIPFTLLGMLAVDQGKVGQGIGCGLVKDALIRTYEKSIDIASCGLVVDVRNNKEAWYEKMGFTALPDNKTRLILAIKDIAKNTIMPRVIEVAKALQDQTFIKCSEMEHITAALALKRPDLLPVEISEEKGKAIIGDRGISLAETIRSQHKRELQ